MSRDLLGTDVRERLQRHKSKIWKTDGRQLLDTVFGSTREDVSRVLRDYVRGFLMVLRADFPAHSLDEHDSFFMSGTRSDFSRLCDYIVDSCMHVFVSICLALVENRLERRVSINSYEKAADLSFTVFLTMIFEHRMSPHDCVSEDASSLMRGLYDRMASTPRAREVARSVTRGIVRYLP